jgi:hypothetical protein
MVSPKNYCEKLRAFYYGFINKCSFVLLLHGIAFMWLCIIMTHWAPLLYLWKCHWDTIESVHNGIVSPRFNHPGLYIVKRKLWASIGIFTVFLRGYIAVNHLFWISYVEIFASDLLKMSNLGIAHHIFHLGHPRVTVTPSDYHPGLPAGVLRHSVRLQTLPQDTSLRELFDLAGMMPLPAQWCKQWQCVIFRSEVGSPQLCRPRQTIAAGLPAFVFLKRAGKQWFWLAASGRGSRTHRYDGHVSGGSWREIFSYRKRREFGMWDYTLLSNAA